jgi:hypothetical protein
LRGPNRFAVWLYGVLLRKTPGTASQNGPLPFFYLPENRAFQKLKIEESLVLQTIICDIAQIFPIGYNAHAFQERKAIQGA